MIDSMIRKMYRKLIPTSFREFVWKVRWLMVSLTADYFPKQEFLKDYDHYWHSREDQAICGLSYGDLIQLCLQEIKDGDTVLDFGCGEGNLLLEIAKVLHINSLGIDVSEHAVELAKQKGVHAAAFHLVEKEDLLQFGHFDVAIATEVLEHIQEAEKIMMALACTSNKILVSIPNTGYFAYRLRLLFGRFPRQWVIHPAEHIRFWTLADFRLTIKLTGLEIVKVSGMDCGGIGRWWPSMFAPALFFVLQSATGRQMIS
jgi:methionine biosynthesis protein MetW